MSPNSQNKREQYNCWGRNIKLILRKLDIVSEGRIAQSVLQKLTARYTPHTSSAGGDIGMARVQRDVGYFLLLTAQGYDFSQYTGDTRDLNSLDESIKEGSRDKYGDVVDIIEQAEEAIETNGEEPDSKTLIQLTQDDAQKMVHYILNKS